jgi:hypothetical protein
LAVEAKRGCGYRKAGGLYIVSGRLSAACCKFPIVCHVCPTCHAGIKPARGWTWIDPRPFLAGECTLPGSGCPAAPMDGSGIGDKAGLLWIGTQHYATPDEFLAEARIMGASRRIPAVPRNFEVGKHWVLMAHQRGVRNPAFNPDDKESQEPVWLPAMVCLFKPTSIDIIVTQSEFENGEKMEALRKRGLTPVPVPDNDPDHCDGVTDSDEPELPLAEVQPSV